MCGHHLELTASLLLGSAFSFLRMAPQENLHPTADDRQLLQRVLLLDRGEMLPGDTFHSILKNVFS